MTRGKYRTDLATESTLAFDEQVKSIMFEREHSEHAVIAHPCRGITVQLWGGLSV